MYLSIKKSYTDLQMSETLFEEKYNAYIKKFEELQETEPGQKDRIRRLIEIKKDLPKHYFMKEKKRNLSKSTIKTENESKS